MAATTLAAVVLLCPGAATGQRVIHRVRFGETTVSIARHYYGNAREARLLRLVNSLGPTSEPQAGDRLRVPTAWTHTTVRRATVAALAGELLGHPGRASVLAHFNRLRPGGRVKAGQTLLVPTLVEHRVAKGETFRSIARRYYGTARAMAMVAGQNLSTPRHSPRVGTMVQVPLGVRLTEPRLEELIKERLLGLGDWVGQSGREGLQEANALLRRGEYVRVPLRVVRLLAHEVASDTLTAEVFRLLAVTYVALELPDLAQEAFREVLLRRPDTTLDPVLTSPRVMAPFRQAQQLPMTGGPAAKGP